MFNLDLNVGSEVKHFTLGGRVFHSPADLLKNNFELKVVLFVFQSYIIVVWIIVASFITRIRSAQIIMDIRNQTIS